MRRIHRGRRHLPRDPSQTPWHALVVLSIAAFWTVTLEMSPAGLLPQLSADLGVRESLIGLLVGAWAITIALTSVPLTRLTRRLSRRHVLGGALLVIAAASLLTAVAPSFPVVALGRALSAVGHGLFWSALAPYAVAVAGVRHQARAVSVVMAGPTLSAVVGLPLATVLAALWGWRLIMAAMAMAILALALMLWVILPRSTTSAAASTSNPAASTTTRRPNAVAAWGIGAGGVILVGHFAVFTFISPLLTQRAGLAENTVGLALLVYGIAGVVGLVTIAPLADRRPKLTLCVVALGMGGALLALATVGLDSDGPAMWVLLALWGMFLGAFPPVQQTVVLGATAPPARDLTGAVLVAVFNGGIAGATVLGGLIFDGPGLAALPVVGGSVIVVTAIVMSITAVRGRRHQPATNLQHRAE